MNINVCDSRAEWDKFVVENGGHPLQLWGWGESKSESDHWQAYRLLVGKIGGAQVLIRQLPKPFGRMAYIPRGPVVMNKKDRSKVLEILAKWAKEQGCIELKAEPDWTTDDCVKIAGFRSSKNTILVPKTVMLDLSQSEDELLAKVEKKTRQYIRKSASEGIIIREITEQGDIKNCLDIYKQTAKRADFGLHSDKYYYDIAEQLGKNNRIFVAEKGGEVLSFLWLAVTPHIAFELYGGVNDRGQELRANYTLKWETVRQIRSEGVKFYDMNGLLNDGISSFKLGFSGKVETILVGALDKPLSPLYGLYEKALPTGKKIIQKMKK